MTNVTRAFHKVGFKLKKHSPEILIVTGVVGVVTSAVLACKATMKVSTIVEKAKKDINDIHDVAADAEAGIIPAEEYTAEDQKKDLTIVYTKTGLEFVKLYAPSVTLGVLSIAAILTSNNILRKRNVALAAAYATTERLFKDYRGRVVDRFGKEVDRELRYNIRAREIEETIVAEDGSEVTEKKTVSVVDGNAIRDEFTRIFDESSRCFVKNPERNKYFILQVENWANIKLREQGFLFMNDVYEALGFDKTPGGQVVGWVFDEKNPIGENRVDFGIFDDLYIENNKRFINGYERCVVLNFNHDGNILEYI
jgi:hypothetical protein